MPSLILQENGSRLLLEDNTGALLQEGSAAIPGTVTVTEAAQPSLTLTGPVTGTLTLKDGAA